MAKRKKEEGRDRARRARGGKAGPEDRLYNAAGSPAAKSAEDDKADGFKRGGRAHRKEGGKVEGEADKGHMGKRARGGPARGSNGQFAAGGAIVERARGGGVPKMARGGSPYSAAHSLSMPPAKGSGHQDEMPKDSV